MNLEMVERAQQACRSRMTAAQRDAVSPLFLLEPHSVARLEPHLTDRELAAECLRLAARLNRRMDAVV